MSDGLTERCHEAAAPFSQGRPVVVSDQRHVHQIHHDLYDMATSGTIVLAIRNAKRGVEILRLPLRSEGYRETRVVVDPGFPDVARLVERGCALLDREDAVADAGVGTSPYPAWSFTAHPVLIRLLAMAGADPAGWTLPSTWRNSRIGERAWTSARDQGGVKLAEVPPFGPGGFGSQQLQASGSRIRAKILTMSLGETRVMMTEAAKDSQIVFQAQLPDTILAGIRGKRLADVLEAEWGDAGDVVVKRATADGDQVTLHLADAVAPVCKGLNDDMTRLLTAAA